ncbi:MAG: FKBP-type peptidyl-prolyl cis-trans isomerase [Planctomycetaceae bacterium]
MKRWTLILLPVIVCAVPGCESPGSKSSRMADAGSANEAPSSPVTFLDKDSLQSGCGPMDSDASKEFLETSSGLRYRILRSSEAAKPLMTDTVEVNYRGWLDNGRQFDSSYGRGEPITFPLNGVIPGWTEGMQLIGEGGMIELWIPSDLGYGPAGNKGIPPNSDLHFIVELIKIK